MNSIVTFCSEFFPNEVLTLSYLSHFKLAICSSLLLYRSSQKPSDISGNFDSILEISITENEDCAS